jgi:A-macroglobulin TED domain
VNWLASNEHADGSFESFPQIPTPGAAFALWLNDSSSSKAAKSFSWIASQLDNSSSYAWGEADIPGLMLYTLGESGSIGLLHSLSPVSSELGSYQAQGSGFMGYYAQLPNGSYAQVVSSVDTSMALLGMFSANSPISQQNRTFATNYLVRLQNNDGSFNLTSAISQSSTNALGPEPISLTALVLLALRYEGKFNADDSHVSKALSFLTKEVSENFTISSDHRGHVYGAALSALVFQAYSRPVQAAASIAFILTQQNPDGSFLDVARGSSQKTLDTGWVTVALEKVEEGPLLSPFLTPIAIIGIVVLVGVVAVLAVLVASLVIRRRGVTSSVPQTGQERAR